MRISTKRKEV